MPPFALLICVLSAPVAWAETPIVDPFDEPEEADLFALEDRLVTSASRYAQTLREAPAIVMVVTDREIRQYGHRTLSDVLRSLPGIHVTQTIEGRSLAWFRGVSASDNNKFLLIVDGVPWYDGIYTHAWIDEYLPLAIVKQVEVIKGPGSAIYGTNAFAGVVNIVTYSPEDMANGFIRLEGASRNSLGATVVGSGDLGSTTIRSGFTAWARHWQANGDGLETTPKGERNVQGSQPVEALNAGLRLRAEGFELHFDHIDYQHTYVTKAQDNLVDVLLQSEDEFQLAYRNELLFLRWDVLKAREHTLAPFFLFQEHNNPGLYAYGLGITTENDESGNPVTGLDGTLVETEKHSRRVAGGLEAETRPAYSHVTVAGAGAEAIKVIHLEDIEFSGLEGTTTSISAFQADPESWISDVYAYFQDTWTPRNWLELVGGIRADYNLTAKYFFPSPRAGVLMVPTPALSAKLLYGRAFRAPNARELLVEVALDDAEEDYPYTNGNPNLEPEIIDTLEWEGNWSPNRKHSVRLLAFGSQVTHTIEKRDTPPNEYTNKDPGTRIAGAEVGWSLRKDHWETDLAWSLTLGTDLRTEFAVYGVPIQMGNARVGWQAMDGLWVNVLADFVGPQPRAQWTPLSRRPDGAAYTLVHASLASHTLRDGRVRLDVSCHNLLDTEYEHLIPVDLTDDLNADGSPKYPENIEGDGRSFRVGLEVDF